MEPSSHVRSKKERLQWLVDQVAEAMGTMLKVKGSADAMLVVEVNEDGETCGYPFGHVRRPAAEILTAMRFVLMALQAKLPDRDIERLRGTA